MKSQRYLYLCLKVRISKEGEIKQVFENCFDVTNVTY